MCVLVRTSKGCLLLALVMLGVDLGLVRSDRCRLVLLETPSKNLPAYPCVGLFLVSCFSPLLFFVGFCSFLRGRRCFLVGFTRTFLLANLLVNCSETARLLVESTSKLPRNGTFASKIGEFTSSFTSKSSRGGQACQFTSERKRKCKNSSNFTSNFY